MLQTTGTPKIPITVIVGPTAVGKTSFSIQLAHLTNSEIISADSRCLYRGMDIGTAKPSVAEREGIPHHLIDVANPDETWSLALFQKRVKEAAEDIYSRGKNIIIVGGTGQYIRAILEGWSIPPQKPDTQMRDILTCWANEIGAEEIHHKLALIDPEAASHIEYQNIRRTVRALEVIFSTGQLFSSQRAKTECPFQALVIGLNRPRAELYERIDKRIDLMIQNGFIDEVEGLLQAGYGPELPSMSAIGYREIIAYLQGKCTLDEAVMLIKRGSRSYVRRQANWFKDSDPNIFWYRNL